eukprot:gene17071-biopygen12783
MSPSLADVAECVLDKLNHPEPSNQVVQHDQCVCTWSILCAPTSVFCCTGTTVWSGEQVRPIGSLGPFNRLESSATVAGAAVHPAPITPHSNGGQCMIRPSHRSRRGPRLSGLSSPPKAADAPAEGADDIGIHADETPTAQTPQRGPLRAAARRWGRRRQPQWPRSCPHRPPHGAEAQRGRWGAADRRAVASCRWISYHRGAAGMNRGNSPLRKTVPQASSHAFAAMQEALHRRGANQKESTASATPPPSDTVSRAAEYEGRACSVWAGRGRRREGLFAYEEKDTMSGRAKAAGARLHKTHQRVGTNTPYRGPGPRGRLAPDAAAWAAARGLAVTAAPARVLGGAVHAGWVAARQVDGLNIGGAAAPRPPRQRRGGGASGPRRGVAARPPRPLGGVRQGPRPREIGSLMAKKARQGSP